MDSSTIIKISASVLLLSACSQHESPQPTGNSVTQGGDKPVTSNARQNLSIEKLTVEQQVAGAIRDLSDRVKMNADDIRVYRASSVTWGSGAMGCPEKNMSYTQAVVPGLLVILEAGGKLYRYHGKAGGELFHCPDSRARAPAYGQGEDVM